QAACGGQSRISADDYVEGAPELIVKIAASSTAYDLYEKQQVYRLAARLRELGVNPDKF
ncbi:MAG: hypothetical protein F6J97_04340, partial [Leptolyngbya sp. SIO4C1]|nr:hypothetical protein [Leptolyngbya sp. SIO4C1]